MKNLIQMSKALFLTLFSFTFITANAHEGPEVTPVMIKDLTDIPGKDALMITVDYKPGEVEIPHRHNAHCFLYVLEGTVVMGVKDGKEVVLKAGQSFYEGPNDIHTVGRNASKTKPAKFLVLILKNKGAPAVIPLK